MLMLRIREVQLHVYGILSDSVSQFSRAHKETQELTKKNTRMVVLGYNAVPAF